MGWNWSFASMLYSSSWRKYRSTFQRHFNSRATARYEPLQLKEVQTFLHNLYRAPENLYYHTRRCSLILTVMRDVLSMILGMQPHWS